MKLTLPIFTLLMTQHTYAGITQEHQALSKSNKNHVASCIKQNITVTKKTFSDINLKSFNYIKFIEDPVHAERCLSKYKLKNHGH